MMKRAPVTSSRLRLGPTRVSLKKEVAEQLLRGAKAESTGCGKDRGRTRAKSDYRVRGLTPPADEEPFAVKGM